MSTALLRGADHPQIGEIASIAEGGVAIALSRGGAAKTYHHQDPNEDSVGYRVSPFGAVAVVADGHSGSQASILAVEGVLERHARRWLEPSPIALEVRFATEAIDVVQDVNTAIVQAALEGAGRQSRTTLTLALVRPKEGFAAVLSMGDSHAFWSMESGTREVAAAARNDTLFLGHPASGRERLESALRVETLELREGDALVLATDGLSEVGIGVEDPAGVVAASLEAAAATPIDLRARTLARGIVEEANAAHRANRAGDNAAAAVLWLDARLR